MDDVGHLRVNQQSRRAFQRKTIISVYLHGGMLSGLYRVLSIYLIVGLQFFIDTFVSFHRMRVLACVPSDTFMSVAVGFRMVNDHYPALPSLLTR